VYNAGALSRDEVKAVDVATAVVAVTAIDAGVGAVVEDGNWSVYLSGHLSNDGTGPLTMLLLTMVVLACVASGAGAGVGAINVAPTVGLLTMLLLAMVVLACVASGAGAIYVGPTAPTVGLAVLRDMRVGILLVASGLAGSMTTLAFVRWAWTVGAM